MIPGAILIGLLLLIPVLLFRKRKTKGKNFFQIPPNPKLKIEMEKEERKKRLKRKFKADQVPSNLDAIIVGSGVGGLMSGCLLAKAKKKVLVLEKTKLGGCTHTFCKQGFEFDVGIHYIGNMEDGSLNRFLFDYVTDGRLKWAKIDEQFDTVVFDDDKKGVRKYDYYATYAKSEQSLIRSFPGEAAAVRRYFKILHELRSIGTQLAVLKWLPQWVLRLLKKTSVHRFLFKNYIKYSALTVEDVINDVTDNEELRAVLGYSFGDYGSLPSETPFLMHALLSTHMIRSGGYYPLGGASEIAYQMIPVIEESGGACFSGAAVSEIIVRDGKACGVRIGDTELFAPVVISNAGVFNTFDKLLCQKLVADKCIRDDLRGVRTASSFMQTFVGLEGTKEELQLPSKQFWVFTGTNLDEATQEYLNKDCFEAANSKIPLLFVSFPSAKDDTFDSRHPGKSTCAIVTFSNYEWFKEWAVKPCHKRGPEYDGIKNAFGEQAWSQVLKLFPHLKDKVAYMETGSPLTHAHYINSPNGEIYGINHNVERFEYDQAVKLRPETAIPGLYLTGQDVFTCGFVGAAFGGLLCASKVLDVNLLKDLVEFIKVYRKQMPRVVEK